MGKPDGKKPFGRHRRRRKDDSKIDVKEVGWGGGAVGWIEGKDK